MHFPLADSNTFHGHDNHIIKHKFTATRWQCFFTKIYGKQMIVKSGLRRSSITLTFSNKICCKIIAVLFREFLWQTKESCVSLQN